MQSKLGFLKKNLAMDVEEFRLPTGLLTSPDQPKGPASPSVAQRAQYMIPLGSAGILLASTSSARPCLTR